MVGFDELIGDYNGVGGLVLRICTGKSSKWAIGRKMKKYQNLINLRKNVNFAIKTGQNG
jgi:hypothetical protein